MLLLRMKLQEVDDVIALQSYVVINNSRKAGEQSQLLGKSSFVYTKLIPDFKGLR